MPRTGPIVLDSAADILATRNGFDARRGWHGGRMQELGFDEFTKAWATYWGRRAIGVVIPNPIADTIASDPHGFRKFYDSWRASLAAYPATASLRLMGSPALTPGLIDVNERWPEADVPRPASFGAYATGTSTGLPSPNVPATTPCPSTRRARALAQDARCSEPPGEPR
ncbi:hypothetical protein [Leifsonia poae]|uniref:hypothetical protein n=1 Tax=Leifsonia poae TaxID=110933 RepID=UPI003D67EFC5